MKSHIKTIDGVLMRTMFAIQSFVGGRWETTQLFGIREYADAKVARLGKDWRVEIVLREVFD